MAENAQQAPAAEATAGATATEPNTKKSHKPHQESSAFAKTESQSGKPISPAAHMIVSGILSIFCFVLSLPLLAYAIWLFYMRDYDCENLLRLPRVQTLVSVSLIAMFIVSNTALVLRRRSPMPMMVVMVVSLVLMLFMGLAYVGVNEMQSRRIPATPMWFKLKVVDNVKWNNIKSCIYHRGACNDLVFRSFAEKSYGFSMHKWSSIESACCIPPATCEMEYVNATYWRRKEGRLEEEGDYYDTDCDLWRNERSALCYDCRACKHGFIRSLRKKWWQLGVFFIVMSVLLLLSHFLLFLANSWERLKGCS